MRKQSIRFEIIKASLPLALFVLGVLELLAKVIGFGVERSLAQFEAASSASAFIPVTVGVLLVIGLPADLMGMKQKALATVFAIGFAAVRIVLFSALLVVGATSGGLNPMLVIEAAVGVGLGLIMACAAGIAYLAAKPRAAVEVRAAPVRQSAAVAANPVNAAPGSAAPNPPRQPLAQPLQWHRGSAPWPRRDEDDPQGTLIRPPRYS